MKFNYDLKIGKLEKISPSVGMHSLVGIRGTPPHSWGNYFSLMDGTRVWNFWAENLKAAKQFLPDNSVNIVRYDNGCIILDERIPEDWYYNKLCFTGGQTPSVEAAKEIYDILGDPNNEFEQFVDPVSYYAKRGGTYITKNGFSWVSYNIPAGEPTTGTIK